MPVVVQLEGNNGKAGKRTLAESGPTVITGGSMFSAVQKVVSAIGK